MRIVVTLAALAALVAACSKESPKGASDPATPSAEPAVKSAAPADKPAEPVVKSAESAAKPAEPVVKPAAPADKPAAPVVKPAAPADKAAAAADKPAPLTADELKELERRPGATPALKQHELPVPAAVAGFAGAPGASPASGPDDALVKVVVFSDFQCPVCRRAAEPVKQLEREFGADVQVIWKHNALPSHRNAEGAAIAAIAAQRQGKFWELHDLLFENQRRLEAADLEAYATQLGLDLERFRKDLADPVAKAQVDYERALAESLEARGTPSFFVNGHKSVGWGSYFGIRAQVARAINKAKQKVAAGTPRSDVARLETAASGDEGKRLATAVWGAKTE